MDSLNPCFNGRYSQSLSACKNAFAKKGLNPCFNGRYSQSNDFYKQVYVTNGLNPCFNGRYSQRTKNNESEKQVVNVLILVLMEDTLRDLIHKYYNKDLVCVLILVLMEDTLRVINEKDKTKKDKVLILVLMEDTLRDLNKNLKIKFQSLNPCFNGRYSQRAKTCVPLFIVV